MNPGNPRELWKTLKSKPLWKNPWKLLEISMTPGENRKIPNKKIKKKTKQKNKKTKLKWKSVLYPVRSYNCLLKLQGSKVRRKHSLFSSVMVKKFENLLRSGQGFVVCGTFIFAVFLKLEKILLHCYWFIILFDDYSMHLEYWNWVMSMLPDEQMWNWTFKYSSWRTSGPLNTAVDVPLDLY